MSNADSNYVRLSFWPEASFNTLNTMTMAMQNFPMTKESLSFGKKTDVSAEIRSDRNVQDTIWTGAEPTGSVDFELSDYAPWFSTFLTAGIMSDATTLISHFSLVGCTVADVNALSSIFTFPSAVATLTSTQIYAANETVTVGGKVYAFKAALTGAANEVLIGVSEATCIANLVAAVNGAAGVGATYGAGTVANANVSAVATTGHVVTFTAITPGLGGNAIASTTTAAHAVFSGATLAGAIDVTQVKLGRAMTFKNLADTTGKTVGSVVIALGTNTFTVAPNVGFNGTVNASAEFSNAEIKNGKTRQSFFLERYFSDLNEAVGFTGQMIDSIDLSIDSQKIITGSMKFMGCGFAQNGTFTPASRTSTSGDVLSASTNVGALVMGNLTAMVKSSKITIKNNLRAQPYVNSVYPGGIGVGRFEVTGTLEIYFNDISTYTAMTGNALVDLIIGIDLNGYALALYLPKIRLLKGDPTADGVNRDVMLSLDFQSVLVNNSEGATLVVSNGTTPA